jgi:hypothetical protein
MTLDKGKIDQAVLALLYLGLHDGACAWKGFDWDALNRLHEKGFIANPRGKSKVCSLTADGLDEARRLLEQLYSAESDEHLWIMVAGPYRSGSSDPIVWAENLRKLNLSANAIFQKGHVPIIGTNMALPVIQVKSHNVRRELRLAAQSSR